MNVNKMIAQQACNAIFSKGYTPDSIALSIGISPQVIRDLCDGKNVETSTVGMLSRGLGINLFKEVATMIDNEIDQ